MTDMAMVYEVWFSLGVPPVETERKKVTAYSMDEAMGTARRNHLSPAERGAVRGTWSIVIGPEPKKETAESPQAE